MPNKRKFCLNLFEHCQSSIQSKFELSLTPHLERVLVVLAALAAVEPGEVVVDPGLGGAGHVRHVGLQAPQLDLRLQRVRVAPRGTAYPILGKSQSPGKWDGGPEMGLLSRLSIQGLGRKISN